MLAWTSHQRNLLPWLSAALMLMPLSSTAQSGVVGVLCKDSRSSAQWSFSIDFENQLVSAEVPVNWTWITPTEVLFLHSAVAAGHLYLTQSYTLNRQTWALQMCDYASDSETLSPCGSQYVCRPISLISRIAF